MEQRTFKYINEQLGTYQENLTHYRRDLSESMTSFSKRVDDIQSETLWRIKDCEELLRVRVSDKYVNDAIKSLDEKINRQITFQEEKGVERLEKAFKELGSRVAQTNQFFSDKLDDVRKVMSGYDAKIANLASTEKLNLVQTGYKDMKYNFERELELLQEHIKEVQDKGGELGKRISNLEQATYD